MEFILILIIVILGGPIVIAGGIIIYFAELMFGLPLIILGFVIFLVLYLAMYPLIYSDHKKLTKIQELKEKEQIETILEIVRNKNEDMLKEPDPFFAVMALIDLSYRDLLPILKKQLTETTNSQEITLYLWFLNLFALKLGYSNIVELLEHE
ncbi:MAG: hypothetical protein GF308_14050 [Candidatus Heimdallarchaeota archaeon]|nr:hypothetical protein [Candidatus Heimdallarchaeota archaeon]